MTNKVYAQYAIVQKLSNKNCTMYWQLPMLLLTHVVLVLCSHLCTYGSYHIFWLLHLGGVFSWKGQTIVSHIDSHIFALIDTWIVNFRIRIGEKPLGAPQSRIDPQEIGRQHCHCLELRLRQHALHPPRRIWRWRYSARMRSDNACITEGAARWRAAMSSAFCKM